MRILYITDALTGHDQRFVDLLLSNGYEVGYVRREGSASPDDYRHAFGRDLWVRELREANALRALASAIADFEPQVLLAGPMHTAASLAAQVGFHPLISISWGSDVLLHGRRSASIHEAIERALFASDAVVCDCDAVREELQRYTSAGKRWLQFPWGIHRSRFRARPADNATRAVFRVPEDAHLVITLRSWAAGYNVAFAVRAAALAMQHNHRMHFLLAGDGPLRLEVEAAIAGSGVADRIHLAGRLTQAELPDYLFASDTYLSCAEMDGSSITLLEAMAAGLPCVVTRAGGNPEWIESGDNGWLCGTEDLDGFSRALLAAAALSPDARLAMAQSSQQKIAHRADWPGVAAPLLNFLADLRVQHSADIAARPQSTVHSSTS